MTVRFCGAKAPHPVIASRNRMYMTFTSDGSVQRKGFIGTHSTGQSGEGRVTAQVRAEGHSTGQSGRVSQHRSGGSNDAGQNGWGRRIIVSYIISYIVYRISYIVYSYRISYRGLNKSLLKQMMLGPV